MIVSLIVAKAKNNAIGKDNNLLWRLPADMKFFKETTSGHCIITGRKNYESIPLKFRPLPNRENIIVTRNTSFSEEGIDVVHSIENGLELARKKGEKEVFIIGGGQIYAECLSKGLIDKMYITEVDANFEADTFFPDFETNKWSLEHNSKLPFDAKNKLNAEITIWNKKEIN